METEDRNTMEMIAAKMRQEAAERLSIALRTLEKDLNEARHKFMVDLDILNTSIARKVYSIETSAIAQDRIHYSMESSMAAIDRDAIMSALIAQQYHKFAAEVRRLQRFMPQDLQMPEVTDG